MIEANVWLALKSRLDQWTECLISHPDALFSPTADKPYIIVQQVCLYYDPVVLQWNCGDEYRGLLNLSACVPTTEGFAAHLGLAGRIGAWFPGGATYTENGSTVEIYERARVIGAPRLDGAHNRLEVQIPWRSWYQP